VLQHLVFLEEGSNFVEGFFCVCLWRNKRREGGSEGGREKSGVRVGTVFM